LAEHGWYLDFEIPFTELWKLQKAFEEGEIAQAENALIEYYDDQADEIEKYIIDKFPHREHIIRSAFKAHAGGEYNLSIPVFLSQTDGICKEVFDGYLFMKDNKKPCTALYLKKIAADAYKAAIFSPLAVTTSIGASERERADDFTGLNRHMVLHGESLDYGTKTNSLKSLSLLNYVTQVFLFGKPTKDVKGESTKG
jgi:hypothetical protein